ncbi:MAG: hypothetical protein V4724_09230 [Pseudomonadota bacterium]
MKLPRLPLFILALLAAAGMACAQAQDGEWVSYRDAYRAMVVFEKYGQPKQFLQHHYQVSPKEGATLDGVRLTLSGKTTRLDLPLDAAGRAVFPLLKAAYDENAVLALNRKRSQYTFQARVSIVVRPDGVYEAADLRSACEQALNYQRYADGAAYRNRKCVGVRFAFARKAEADVRVRKAGHDGAALPAQDGPAFMDDADDRFRTVNYRFADWPEPGQVVSRNAPLAIAPLYD